MDTQEFGCSDSLPEWKFCIVRRITETVITKLSENNVTYVKVSVILLLPSFSLNNGEDEKHVHGFADF
jgi:hypothetical protein